MVVEKTVWILLNGMNNLLKNKVIKSLVFLLILGIVLFLFKTPILKSAGNFLIQEDNETFAPVTFVLGGNSFDRGMKALDIYNKKLTDKIVCSGGNIPSVLEAIDTVLYEAEITKALLVKNQVPTLLIHTLTTSTSTLEESNEILSYCLNNNIKTATIISSKFHLRRVRNVFEDKFDSKGIKLNFVGASSSNYDEAQWWKSEEGMIMVNNEYMKLVYYLVK